MLLRLLLEGAVLHQMVVILASVAAAGLGLVSALGSQVTFFLAAEAGGLVVGQQLDPAPRPLHGDRFLLCQRDDVLERQVEARDDCPPTARVLADGHVLGGDSGDSRLRDASNDVLRLCPFRNSQ